MCCRLAPRVQAGDVIGEAWDHYKAHWQHLLPFALVVYLILGLVSLVLTLALGWLGAILGAFIGIIGVFWLQGALVEAVADIRDGRADLTMGQTFSRAQQHLGTLAIAGILAGLAVAVGFVLLIAPGLYLLTIWSVLIPAIVLERRGVMEAFGRSRELVSGYGWSAFGVVVLCFLILIGVSIVVEIATIWLGGAFGDYVRSVISNTIGIPFLALALTNMYFRLRAVKEAPVAPAPEPTPPPA
jgi:hypothetical protein